MNLAYTLTSFLFVAILFQPAKSDAGGEDNLFLRHSGRARGNYGNSTNGFTPRNRNRNRKGNRATKLDPCQTVVDFWTPERIKSACTTPLHPSFDGDEDGDRNRGLEGRDLQASVVDDPWVRGGDILQAAGRLLFRMGGRFSSCSATAVTDDDTTGRSIIVTAAHCVFSSSTKKFADYFMFIPNQDDGGSDTSDLNCNNDLFGCWTPSFAVVDNDWASQSWSRNIPADYAFLVVDDVGNHRGPSGVSDVLDEAVPAMDVSFKRPNYGKPALGMGYSGNRDPDFRYCMQDLDHYPNRGGYILNRADRRFFRGAVSSQALFSSSQLSSSHPSTSRPILKHDRWFQKLNKRGRGNVIAVNSYGPGGGRGYMGGPRLHDNSAQCLFEIAKSVPGNAAAGGGIVVTYGDDCESATYVSGIKFNGGGGGSCARCSRYQDAYDQACCNAYGGNDYYARYVSWRGSIYCGRCS